MEKVVLITVLGWEDRFIEGCVKTLDSRKIDSVVLIVFGDYSKMDKMLENKEKLEKKLAELSIELSELQLEYGDTVSNWKNYSVFFNEAFEQTKFLLNITTVPRESIWTLLYFLRQITKEIEYIYFKPEKYCEEWLTKNHRSPRLLFKHSGLFELDNDLVLFIITGFDDNRLMSLVDFYEPTEVVIFTQVGQQFDNEKRNNGFKVNPTIEFSNVEIDNYNVEEASKIIWQQIEKYKDHNIIVSSQGPKLSSLSTYLNYIKSEERIALAYVPARDFNKNYSQGTDPESISGKLIL